MIVFEFFSNIYRETYLLVLRNILKKTFKFKNIFAKIYDRVPFPKIPCWVYFLYLDNRYFNLTAEPSRV